MHDVPRVPMDQRSSEKNIASPQTTTPNIPFQSRFEGMWVVGLPGTGKTQLFQYLIARDLDLVAQGRASIIVLDPTGDEADPTPTLIHNLIRLKRFAPGGDLHGKLVYIDPTDTGYTLPINLFSLRPDLNDREAISSAIQTYVSIMGGLMGQPLTGFQDPPFRYAVQAALAFAHPTLETLRRVLAVPPPATKSYTPPPPYHQQVIDRLRPTVAEYLRTTFDSDGARRSRNELMNRLYALSADPRFAEIFEAEETKIDFAAEIASAKVIVINASREALGDMTELYGRYFLGLIKQAADSRRIRVPCFIYIDECNEFVANDHNAVHILRKLRRRRMALVLGNQAVEDIKTPRGAFLGTAIKLVNADEDSAYELAKNMGLRKAGGVPDTSLLVGRPPLDFAFHIRGRMHEPESFKVPPGVMEAMLKMTESEFQEIRKEIRERYYVEVHRDRPSKQTRTMLPAKTNTAAEEPVAEPVAPTQPETKSKSEGGTDWGLPSGATAAGSDGTRNTTTHDE